MYFDEKLKKELNHQIEEASKIQKRLKEERKEKKEQDCVCMVANGLVAAGKMVMDKQGSTINKMQERGNRGDARTYQRREDQFRSNFDNRRRMRIGILLEKYFPEYKELSVNEIETELQKIAKMKGNADIHSDCPV